MKNKEAFQSFQKALNEHRAVLASEQVQAATALLRTFLSVEDLNSYFSPNSGAVDAELIGGE